MWTDLKGTKRKPPISRSPERPDFLGWTEDGTDSEHVCFLFFLRCTPDVGQVDMFLPILSRTSESHNHNGGPVLADSLFQELNECEEKQHMRKPNQTNTVQEPLVGFPTGVPPRSVFYMSGNIYNFMYESGPIKVYHQHSLYFVAFCQGMLGL